MIYLIESEEFYKIGYTKDLMERLKVYATHNPNIKVLDIIEFAGRNEEKQLHKLLDEYKYNNEWFNKDNNVIKTWKAYKETFVPIEMEIDKKIYKILNKQQENLEKLTTLLCTILLK